MGSSREQIALTIGTAGHVDHGKTTLIRYMTGTDTDRLEEEHRRGISIVPGYAELALPSGHHASIVDAPGHERFVKNMVSGATGVDAFLLVVAADDGVMPQTREHLDVLRLLGVERGVVALTKVDMVDEETAELAQLDAEELLESVSVEAPVFRVSGVTGEGVDELLAALDGFVEGSGHQRPGVGLARLPVDRAFLLKGIGVVVTGTLWSGEVRAGDTLHTASGHRPRVRGVQNHGRPAEAAHPGARTALDLAGVEAGEIETGEVLASQPVPQTRSLDARLELLETSPVLKHGVKLRLHHGTRSTNAHVRLMGRGELAPGESAFVRLRLDEPLTILGGDRFVVRSLSPQVTIGGGTALDPAPADRRPSPEWLEALERGDAFRSVPLALARSPKDGLSAEDLALTVLTTTEELRKVPERVPEVVEIGGLYALGEEVEAARERLLKTLRRRADERPENPEVSVAEARAATGLGGRLADALLGAMEGEEISTGPSGVGLPGSREAPEELEDEARELSSQLNAAGAEPPAMEETPALRLLLRREEAVRLGERLFASEEVAGAVIEEIKGACRKEGEISLAGFRDLFGTSRKYAQAWLEYADSAGVTSRTGDVRVLTRRYRQEA